MLDSSDAVDAERVRDRTREAVHGAVDADSPVLIEAPPNSGKSTSSYELAHVADTPVTYLASRIDLYKDAKSWVEDESGIRVEEIPSPQRFCDTFSGDMGEQKKVKQLYSKGMSGMRIHHNENVYTPCHSEKEGEKCDYVEKYETVDTGLKDGTIDFLIGNHKHAQNPKYIANRIVVLDEFNASPFIERYPSENDLVVSDHPGDMVSDFLDELANLGDAFPTETYQDVTDILLHRQEPEPLEAALEWFEDHGVTRGDVKKYDDDFYEVTSFKYNSAHLLAPLITLSFLCMRQVGKGVELAPPPSRYEEPRVREAWKESGLHENLRVVRNRNSGVVFVLRSPNLSTAQQVIGLDGLPTKRLWDLIFASGSEFDRRQVISREDFAQYLSEALDMTVKQFGKGNYSYSGGRTSKLDKYRFAAIKTLEGRRFALISTKKALEKYEKQNSIEPFVKPAPDTFDDDDGQIAMMNYGSMLSSNAFKKEDLGVVAGRLSPGRDVLRRWAAFCGEEYVPEDEKHPKWVTEASEEIRHYFKHQLVQAILRFGRHEDVWSAGGSTVYVTSKKLPDWFEPSAELTLEQNSKKIAMIEFLIHAAWTDEKRPMAVQNATSIIENLDISIDRSYVHDIKSELQQKGIVVRSDTGKDCAFKWAGDDYLHELDGVSDQSHMLCVGEKIYLLDV